MKILYCRIGFMESYNGISNSDFLKSGGSYNDNNIGHEVYNFSSYQGKFYGFVQPVANTINIDKITGVTKCDFVDDVLVIFVAKRESYGQVIVGWYKNATIYRKLQTVDNSIMDFRELKTHFLYNIYSDDVTLILPIDKRTKCVVGMGQSNVWFGNDEVNDITLNYINEFENILNNKLNFFENIEGVEKEVIVKSRVNQSKFRDMLLTKYNCCCLCGIANPKLLVASHIKPWSNCNKIEKLNHYNGLLLCSMHDKLFDLGLISFSDNGKILISNEISVNDKKLLNIPSNICIQLDEDSKFFIKYHREHIFK